MKYLITFKAAYIIIHNYVNVINRVLKTHSFGRIFTVENGKQEWKDEDESSSNNKKKSEQLPFSDSVSHPVVSSHQKNSVDGDERAPDDGSDDVETTREVDPMAKTVKQI